MKRILVVLGVLIAGLAFADSARAQNYVRDGFGKCMHVPQESRANGVQLRTWDCIDRAHLKWEKPLLLIDFAAEAGRQYFWLKNNLTGKCAAVHKGQHHDGSPVVQWDCESSLHFQWSELGNTGQIIHRESQKCLHSASGSNYATLVIRKCADIRDQISGGRRWTREGPYVRNGFGTCLHVPNESHENGVQLTTWDCIETPHLQIWWADINEEIYGGGFRLFISRMSDKCMAVHAGQKHDGAWVVQWSCSRILPEGGHNLQWKVENYQLMHRESGKCLHVASSAWNSPATLGTCAQTVVPAGMKWTIGG